MKNSVLTKSQVEALAKYCKEKNARIDDYLFREMGFSFRENDAMNGIFTDLHMADPYLVADAQSYDCARTERHKSKTTVEYTYHYRANLIDMSKVGATVTNKKEIYSRCEGKNSWKNFQLLCFQKG